MNISKRFKNRAKVWFLPRPKMHECLVLDYANIVPSEVNEFFSESFSLPRAQQSNTLMCQQVGRAVRYYIPRRR